MKLEDFKKLNEGKKKRSKLHLFVDEILELKNEGYTLQLILDFLAKNNIKSSKTNLFHFICRVEKKSKVKEEVKKDTEPKVKADTRSETKEDQKVTDDDKKGKIEEYFQRIGHGKKNKEEIKESEEEKLLRLYGYRKK